MEHPKTYPYRDRAYCHHEIQSAGVVGFALYTLKKNAVMKEVEGGPGYRERDRHGDGESHREVSSSSDPFRRLLRDPREKYGKSGSQELIDQDCQCQRKLGQATSLHRWRGDTHAPAVQVKRNRCCRGSFAQVSVGCARRSPVWCLLLANYIWNSC